MHPVCKVQHPRSVRFGPADSSVVWRNRFGGHLRSKSKRTYHGSQCSPNPENTLRAALSNWNLKAQLKKKRHIGPVAQDFNGSFGYLFGELESPIHINTMAAIGVSMAVIQGLCQLLQEKIEKIASLEARNALQQEQIYKLQKQVDRISAAPEGLKQAMTGPSALFMVSLVDSGGR